MKRSLGVLMLVAMPLTALADGCLADKPEKFDKFFNRFVKDADFAKKRSRYPIVVSLYERGSQEVKQSEITAEDDSDSPALADHMRVNDLSFGGAKLKKNAATVSVFGKEPAVRLGYSFVREQGCWYLQEIEDRAE
jgi:hypothetical protein